MAKCLVKMILRNNCQVQQIELQGQEGRSDVLDFSVGKLLHHLNRFLAQQHSHQIVQHASLEVTINDSFTGNLYELMKSNKEISLFKGNNDQFEIKVEIQDRDDKSNMMLYFSQKEKQFTAVNSNIERIIKESEEAQKQRGSSSRPVDIAFFFADPLVRKDNGKIQQTVPEVSYQLEYDNFIELVKKEEFSNNFRIQMMVATKTNISRIVTNGATVLHFACHGSSTHNLQIQSEKSVGELLQLDCKSFTSFLDPKNPLPKLIIFNVCHSHALAKSIGDQWNRLGIKAIGYLGQAKDKYCQQMTRELYMGLFKDEQSVDELFLLIKNRITAQNKQQGDKLCMFPQSNGQQQKKQKLFGIRQSKINYVKRWTELQSMRQNELIGVRKEMFNFINSYLLHNEWISYLFLLDQPSSGKTSFIKKVKMYTINRNCFTDELVVDLRNSQGKSIKTMLQLKLQKQAIIDRRVREFKNEARNGRTVPLIVFDHCDSIIAYQLRKFQLFIKKAITDVLKNGKVVIVANEVEPQDQNRQIFKRHGIVYRNQLSNQLNKKPIHRFQVYNYIYRYIRQPSLRQSVKELYQKEGFPENQIKIEFVKAIKHCQSTQTLHLLEQHWQSIKQQIKERKQKKREAQIKDANIDSATRTINTALRTIDTALRTVMAVGQVQEQLKAISDSLGQLQPSYNIKIQQNHILFLSTIFDYRAIHSQSRQIGQTALQDLSCLFQSLYQRMFEHIHIQQIVSIVKQLFDISLRLACILYLSEEYCLFQSHMMNCQHLWVLVRIHTRKNDIDNKQFRQIATVYHIRILLALYGYYSETTNNQNREQCVSKLSVIECQLQSEYDKPNHRKEQDYRLIKKLLEVSKMSQDISCDEAYNFTNNHELVHRQSGSNDDFYDLAGPEQIMKTVKNMNDKVSLQHDKIKRFWENCLFIRQASQWHIIVPKSVQLMMLNTVKLVNYNLSQLQQINLKGECFLTQSTLSKLKYYAKILSTIDQAHIFPTWQGHSQHGLFSPQQHPSLQGLYQKYFKNYLSTYFRVQKLKQSVGKQYDLGVFYHFISICQSCRYVGGVNSLRKEIEAHINQHFFNIKTCTTLVALPLLQRIKNEDVLCNLKHFQSNIYSFHQKLYHQLDRQVKYEIHRMDPDKLVQLAARKQKSVIDLVICDLKDQRTIYLQSENGFLQTLELNQISLPSAPVVIFFGHNTKEIHSIYHHNNLKSLLIWIDVQCPRLTSLDLQHYSKPKNEQKARQEKLALFGNYSVSMDIYHSLLQFFYCSFCRHFFSTDHELLIQQFHNSYNLAKAQTLIKTKMRFCGRGDQAIRKAIQSIDCNLNFLTGSLVFGKQIQARPAQRFLCKQVCVMRQKHHNKRRVLSEMGCNKQVVELLLLINRKGTESHKILQVMYNSDSTLSHFLSLFKNKIRNNKMFVVKDKVINSYDYEQYHKGRQERQEKGQTTQIIIFRGLTQLQLQTELKQIDKYPCLKIICSNAQYKCEGLRPIVVSMTSMNHRAIYLMVLGQFLQKSHMKDSKRNQLLSQIYQGYLLSLQDLEIKANH